MNLAFTAHWYLCSDWISFAYRITLITSFISFYLNIFQAQMNIMATQITGKKFPQFHHTEKGTLLLWDLAYRDNLVLLHVKTVDIHVILPICLRQVAYFIISHLEKSIYWTTCTSCIIQWKTIFFCAFLHVWSLFFFYTIQ